MIDKLMKFSPATGDEKPYPSHAQQWRDYNGERAFLYNPWTGKQRDSRDVGSDPFGHAIMVSLEPLTPAQGFLEGRPFGSCPECGEAGVTREKRPNGNDTCSKFHTYPSANAK